MSHSGQHSVAGYSIERKIGQGSFAAVYLASDNNTGQRVAIKSVYRSRLNKKLAVSLLNEIAILKEFKHPNIVQLYSVQQTEHFIYLVMEYCQGGDLHHYMKTSKLSVVPEAQVRRIVLHISAALRELCANRLFHRDIKPQNILLTSSILSDATFKLADFGFARHVLPSDLADTLCGSPLYMAPEILRYENYGPKVDLWSVGAIVYELLVGRPPFEATNHIHLLKVIESTEPAFPAAISSDARELLVALLQKDPRRRCSFERFFGHPFLTGRRNSSALEIGARLGKTAGRSVGRGFSLDSNAPPSKQAPIGQPGSLQSAHGSSPKTAVPPAINSNLMRTISGSSSTLNLAESDDLARISCSDAAQMGQAKLASLLLLYCDEIAESSEQRLLILEHAAHALLALAPEGGLSPWRGRRLAELHGRIRQHASVLRDKDVVDKSIRLVRLFALRLAKDGATHELLGLVDKAHKYYVHAHALLQLSQCDRRLQSELERRQRKLVHGR